MLNEDLPKLSSFDRGYGAHGADSQTQQQGVAQQEWHLDTNKAGAGLMLVRDMSVDIIRDYRHL